MHQLFRKKNIASRFTLCVLYFLFFAVQLNLRYQSVDVSRHSVPGTHSSSKQTIAQEKLTVKDRTDGKSCITIRLNKRFFPGHLYLIEPPLAPSSLVVYLEKEYNPAPSPFLSENHTQFSQRRGPPSLA